MNRTLLSTLILATLSGTASAQTAADSVERITVYSSFRNINLAQLDASASVFDQEIMALRQASHIEDILNLAPNINFNSGASRNRFVQIRGIGERSQFAEPINPSVSLLVDGFDFSGLGAAGLLFDVQQVEVFRGPQATLFGGGALAGAIRIQSTAPGETGEQYVDVQLGTESYRRLEGGFGGRASDQLTYRVAGLLNQSDGFVENTFLQRDDTNNLNEKAAKLHIGYEVNAQTEISLRYQWFDIDNGYDAFSLDNDNRTLSDEPGFDRQQTHAVGVDIQHSAAKGDWFVSATVADHDVEYAYDEDWTYDGFHPWGYTSVDYYGRDISTQTAEVRFVSNESAKLFSNTTDWIIGAYYKSTEEDLLRQYTYAEGDFISSYEPTSLAAYAELTTALTRNWQLTTGIRVENFGFDYAHNQGLENDTDTTAVGGKVSLSYVTQDHFYYGSISRGFKAAGINPDQRVSDERRFFDTEYVWNYELGVKSFWHDANVTSRLAVFHMRRKNTQVSDFDVQTREDGSATFIDIIGNADVGTNQGVEAELTWQPIDIWQLAANIGYLSATFEDYELANGDQIAKQRQAQAPKWSGHLSSDIALSSDISWNINLDFKDDYRFSDGHNETSGFTALLNSELAYQMDNIRLALWGKNILDRTYYTRGFGGFSNDPRDEYAFPEPYFQIGNERQLGVSLRYRFN